jgi:hypothetical protein
VNRSAPVVKAGASAPAKIHRQPIQATLLSIAFPEWRALRRSVVHAITASSNRNCRHFLARNARWPDDGCGFGLTNNRLGLKERIPDLDSGNMAPSAAGVDSGANRPTGAAHAALMTKKRVQKPYDENCP